MAFTRRALPVLPAVLLLVLLAGCGGGDDSGADSSAPPTQSVVASPSEEETSADDPASEEPALDLAEFRSESVQCIVIDDELECQLQVEPTYTIPDDYLEFEVPCADVLLTAAETEGHLGCRSDVLSETLPHSDLLPTGTVVTHGGFTCTLLEVGAVCTNEVGGEVEITAEAYRLTR